MEGLAGDLGVVGVVEQGSSEPDQRLFPTLRRGCISACILYILYHMYRVMTVG